MLKTHEKLKKEFHLLGKKVLLELQIDEKPESKFEFIIPDNNKEKKGIGTVVLIGDGFCDKKDENINLNEFLKIGDVVYFSKFTGNEVEIQNKKYLLVNFSDIFMKKI